MLPPHTLNRLSVANQALQSTQKPPRALWPPEGHCYKVTKAQNGVGRVMCSVRLLAELRVKGGRRETYSSTNDQ